MVKKKKEANGKDIGFDRGMEEACVGIKGIPSK